MATLYGWLFGRVLRLEMTGTAPPTLQIHDPATGRFESLGGAGTGEVSLLQLPADPPDFIVVNGETITVEGQ